MDPETPNPKAYEVHVVTSTDSPEFAHFTRALTRSSVVALDAEWKPTRSAPSSASFPAVSLLQLACRLGESDSIVFLLDLLSVSLPSLRRLLADLLVSPDVLKLGFRFKQDLVYLSSTFSSNGCDDHGFDRVEPFVDITSVYNYLHDKQFGKKKSKDTNSLATVCKEVLNISLSKEHQCSDWSQRPLTKEQLAYAAEDAHCLLDIFSVFQAKIDSEWDVISKVQEPKPNSQHNTNLGLKEILETDDSFNKILRINISGALDILQATACSDMFQKTASEEGMVLRIQQRSTLPMSESLLKLVKQFRENLVLKESDKKPKNSRRKRRTRTSSGLTQKEVELENVEEWQGPPPWDLSLGGDGCPKFLCDVMVEGLAKHLRCVGIDAAVPHSKRPGARDLIGQASRENRVLLTRDAKLLRHQYTIKNQIYRVMTLLKNDQLTEVIETFQLKISEGQLMSRCTKCNGRFIQKPLTTEEAVEAAKGFQRIPNCLFNKNLEFWQCSDCKQLYWEGTQYKNAVQKFMDVCKLKDEKAPPQSHAHNDCAQ